MKIPFALKLRFLSYKNEIIRRLKGPKRLQKERLEERIRERNQLIKACKEMSLLDASFSVIYYNKHSRVTGPKPIGDIIDLVEVLQNLPANEQEDLERKATNLYWSASRYSEYFADPKNAVNMREKIRNDHPGFSDDSYRAVLMRAQYMAIK